VATKKKKAAKKKARKAKKRIAKKAPKKRKLKKGIVEFEVTAGSHGGKGSTAFPAKDVIMVETRADGGVAVVTSRSHYIITTESYESVMKKIGWSK
jgi:hypothetical protein